MADVYVLGDGWVSLTPIDTEIRDVRNELKISKKHTVLEGRVSVMNSSART